MNDFLSEKRIGVIGYGMFGKFFCEEFLKNFRVAVYSSHFQSTEGGGRIIAMKSLRELAEYADFVIVAVRAEQFESVIQELAPHLKEGTVVMDVCGVKLHAVRILQRELPKGINKITTHPMVGPSIFKKRRSLSGFPMVMYNAGCDSGVYIEVKDFFVNLGLRVVELSPDEHDRLMAKSQVFAQLVKVIAGRLDLHATPVDAPGAGALFEAIGLMNVSEEQVFNIVKYNPYAREMLEGMIGVLEDLRRKHIVIPTKRG